MRSASAVQADARWSEPTKPCPTETEKHQKAPPTDLDHEGPRPAQRGPHPQQGDGTARTASLPAGCLPFFPIQRQSDRHLRATVVLGLDLQGSAQLAHDEGAHDLQPQALGALQIEALR